MSTDGGATPHTYAAAGVSLDAAEAVVERLRAAVRSTYTPGVVDAHGGFAGLFEVPGNPQQLLVAGTDGVGTKLLLQRNAGRLADAGIDCVGMCVNDVLVTGARPLLFLDYVAVGRLDPERVAGLVEGVAEGCRQAGAALLGGETAEHPGVMADDDIDVAGFCVGIVDRAALVDGSRVEEGDVLVGIASSGLHSNGFSLVRRVLAEHGLAPGDAPGDLLAPTRIYVRDVHAVLDVVDVRAMVHVTGGGFAGNVPRVLPAGAGARIDARSWEWPAVYPWLAGLGVPDDELPRVFNCGVGFILVVPPADAPRALAVLAARGTQAWRIGEVVAGGGVRFEG